MRMVRIVIWLVVWGVLSTIATSLLFIYAVPVLPHFTDEYVIKYIVDNSHNQEEAADVAWNVYFLVIGPATALVMCALRYLFIKTRRYE